MGGGVGGVRCDGQQVPWTPTGLASAFFFFFVVTLLFLIWPRRQRLGQSLAGLCVWTVGRWRRQHRAHAEVRCVVVGRLGAVVGGGG